MRHHNPTIKWSFTNPHGGTIYHPYCNGNYTYRKPNPKCVYVKVVKFVAEHPNCKRIDIIRGIWAPNADKNNARGHQSSLFACLLYDDLLDYNSKFEYNATTKGYDLLRRAGIKEINIIKTITL